MGYSVARAVFESWAVQYTACTCLRHRSHAPHGPSAGVRESSQGTQCTLLDMFGGGDGGGGGGVCLGGGVCTAPGGARHARGVCGLDEKLPGKWHQECDDPHRHLRPTARQHGRRRRRQGWRDTGPVDFSVAARVAISATVPRFRNHTGAHAAPCTPIAVGMPCPRVFHIGSHVPTWGNVVHKALAG